MNSRSPRLRALLCAGVLALAACAPGPAGQGPRTEAAAIGRFFVAGDGEKLSYQSWLPDNPGHTKPPKAVVVAVHGFNDYSNAFDEPARYWATRGIATYAYDQRGFGGNYPRGLWAGREAMVADLRDFATAVATRHPGVPLYLLGSSMGGSVVIAALGSNDPPVVDGAIVLAPAAYGRALLPVSYTASLWLAAHTIPWHTVTGQGLQRIPSDNLPMLRALARDVRVIKGARFDTLYGLVNLMDLALESAPNVRGPLLYLYGEKDDIVRAKPTLALVGRIPAQGRRVGMYENGYHMLLRDLQADVVREDVAAWMLDREAPLPSGADSHVATASSGLSDRAESPN